MSDFPSDEDSDEDDNDPSSSDGAGANPPHKSDDDDDGGMFDTDNSDHPPTEDEDADDEWDVEDVEEVNNVLNVARNFQRTWLEEIKSAATAIRQNSVKSPSGESPQTEQHLSPDGRAPNNCSRKKESYGQGWMADLQ